MLRCSIFDPTGNITALVESETPVPDQPAVAAMLMQRHPEVEQVGFVRGTALRMAGGEFCGNASMCAAALYLLRRGAAADGAWTAVRLTVSGAAEPVETRLRRESRDSFQAEIRMPPALEIGERAFALDGLSAALPLVRMEGISHLIVGRDSAFFALLDERARAEDAVRRFCGELGAEAMGLLFLDDSGGAYRMTPLVYVPGSKTVFWENSCASGSAAVGMHYAARTGAPVDLTLREPGGVLRVKSEPGGGTLLFGGVRLVGEYGPAL